MTLKERIKELCRQKGISMNQLEKELVFATGYISKLEKSTPNLKYIQKIADYFNVSVDYLMNGKEMTTVIEMADIDSKLIAMEIRLKEYALKLSKLPKEKQEHIISSIDMLEK